MESGWDVDGANACAKAFSGFLIEMFDVAMVLSLKGEIRDDIR
ncbi:hypothetical protein [Desulfosoma sp.]